MVDKYMIQEFYKQENPPDDLLDYNAGSIAYEDGEYIVTWAQFGAEKAHYLDACTIATRGKPFQMVLGLLKE